MQTCETFLLQKTSDDRALDGFQDLSFLRSSSKLWFFLVLLQQLQRCASINDSHLFKPENLFLLHTQRSVVSRDPPEDFGLRQHSSFLITQQTTQTTQQTKYLITVTHSLSAHTGQTSRNPIWNKNLAPRSKPNSSLLDRFK